MNEILNTIDERLKLLLPLIEQGQAAYLSQQGVYFQGPVTHSVIPADGAEVAPDRLGYRLTDQTTTWIDVAGDSFPAMTLSAIEIHQSVGPQGLGWMVIVSTELAGVQYQRVIGYGADIDQTVDWFEIGKDAVGE